MFSTLYFPDLGKTRPFIEYIREKFPECTWKWNKVMRQYDGSDGSSVQARTAVGMCCLDACDHYRTQYWRYFPDGKTPQRVLG